MKLSELLYGKARNIFDPELFRKISLVALLAWIGIGADGISSSCYGPEEAYKALGDNHFLVFPLIGLIVLTITVLSVSYSQIIELFPSGGGGYVVTTKFLGAMPGLLAGMALLVDYVLTISISLASGIDALLSFLPAGYHPHKMLLTLVVLAALTVMNLRGVKETVMVLMPVFLTFIVSHVVTIVYGLVVNFGELVKNIEVSCGNFAAANPGFSYSHLIYPVMAAFVSGCGTFTGIEAVSNSTQILKEPKVATARKTMLYMAVSLSFISAGLLLNYVAFDAHPVYGKSLNAVVFENILTGRSAGVLLIVLLVSEAALLFVAAQTGFVGGPRIAAQMALDRWLPRRFVHLSNRLVIQDGIVFICIGAAFFVIVSGAQVSALVVMYSISVFITFVLSQLSVCLHWFRERRKIRAWWWKICLNGLGCGLSGVILLSLVAGRFATGNLLVSLPLLFIGGLIVVAVLVRRHYEAIQRYFDKFKHIIDNPPVQSQTPKSRPAVVGAARTAILLVSGYNFQGIHLYLNIKRLFPNDFNNFVFISVGEVDYGRFKGIAEIESLRAFTADSMAKYVDFVRASGDLCSYKVSVAADVVEEIVRLVKETASRNNNSVVFLGRLIFPQDTFFTRIAHDHTASNIENKLQFEGIPCVSIPLRVDLANV